MNIADFVLRLSRLLHIGIEENKVLVLSLSLSQSVRAAFPIPAVGNGKFRLGEEFARVVRVDQRVERNPGYFVVALFNITHGAVEQNLIRLQGVFGNRGVVLLVTEKSEAGERQKCRETGCYNEETIVLPHQNNGP